MLIVHYRCVLLPAMNRICIVFLFALAALGGGMIASQQDPAAADRVRQAGAGVIVYVDADRGKDSNDGTTEAPLRSIGRAVECLRSRCNETAVIRLAPGIHVIDRPVRLARDRQPCERRFVVEARVLPDDPAWTPAQMPVVINRSGLGEIPSEPSSFVVSFLVEASHVTIRGVKFPGYFQPNSRYFPIARLDGSLTDLRVEQCVFVGDPQAAHLQVGVIAHGSGVRIEHCIFHGVRNAAVFWRGGPGGLKTGNALTHSIIVGATQSAVWTAWPDRDFVFDHNIVSGCAHVWIKNAANRSSYSISDCILVNNRHRTAVADETGVREESFDLGESGTVNEGEIRLRLADDLDRPLPRDYLHPQPGTLGHELGAGLFGRCASSR